jgi:hypothetical protein
MKKILTLNILLYSVMFSSISFGEWTVIGRSVTGDVYYVDFESISLNNGFVRYWRLVSYAKQDKWGEMSVKNYFEGDCEQFRERYFSSHYYRERKGVGASQDFSFEPKWHYPDSTSMSGIVLQQVCEFKVNL